MILNCSPGPMSIPYKRRGSRSDHSDDYPSFASDPHCPLSKGKEPALKTAEDASQVLLSEPGDTAQPLTGSARAKTCKLLQVYRFR